MEKISGILPSTPRITTVDLKNSGTARSGMPSFGRPQTVSVAAQQEQRQKLEQEMFGDASLTTRSKPSSDPHAAIVDRMADSFFMRKGRPAPDQGVGLADPEFQLGADADLDPTTGISAEKRADQKKTWNFENPPATETEEALDQPEVGGYLDVRA